MGTRNGSLSLSLCRADASPPDRFDGQPKDYKLLRDNTERGLAPLNWLRLRDRVASLIDPEPTADDRRSLGLDLRSFLEDLLKKEKQNWSFYNEQVLEADEKKQSTVFNLQLGAVELFALPWELTRLSDGRNLGDIPGCVLQYEWSHARPFAAPSGPPGRLLFAWSGQVPVEDHLQALASACPQFRPERDQVEEASLEKLRAALHEAERQGEAVQVLHLLCHGVELTGGLFGLALNRTTLREGGVDGSRVKEVLGQFKRLQCVVLCACYSSNPGRFESLSGGVAQDLHELGVPVVIGSRMPLSRGGSVKLAEAFYQARYKSGASVYGAFQAARAALDHTTFDRTSLQLLMSSARPDAQSPPRIRRVQFGRVTRLPRAGRGNLAVLTEVNTSISPGTVLDALGGQLGDLAEFAVLRPLGDVGETLPATKAQWKLVFKETDRFAKALIDRVASARSGIQTVHLFSCAPLPLMFHLGFRLTKQPLRVYQQRREWNTWSLGYDHALNPGQGPPFFSQRWPDAAAVRSAGNKVALTVEVTRAIGDDILASWLGAGSGAVVRLTAARGPSPTVVEGPADAARAMDELRKCLDRVGDEFPGVEEVWLALVCPVSFAVALGRAYNPNAQRPTLVLFNYRGDEGYVEVYRPPSAAARRRSRPQGH